MLYKLDVCHIPQSQSAVECFRNNVGISMLNYLIYITFTNLHTLQNIP